MELATEMLLDQKVCIITGATKGIGRAIAKHFAEQGAWVFVNGRDANTVNEIVSDIISSGGQADPFVCDVSDPDSVKLAFKEFLTKSKKLDILVNNAGILEESILGMATSKHVEKMFSTNSFSVVYMSQYASRIMAKEKSGSIINVSSIMGSNGAAGLSIYAGSKAALIGITKSLSKELAQLNIRVNAIAPGFIDTEMARNVPESIFNKRIASIAMGRIGSPDEVAGVAVFLGSNLSTYVTGQVIGIDGGMLI